MTDGDLITAAGGPHRPAGTRHHRHVEGVLTLTDATVAVAVYLKAVRKRRAAPPGSGELRVCPHLEAEFVQAAAVFGKAHRIDFDTWRMFGVDHTVLHRAGIARRHRRS